MSSRCSDTVRACYHGGGVLQFVHPKDCGSFLVVHQWKVLHPEAELVPLLQRDHGSLRGRAQARDRRRPACAVQVTVGLHHNLFLLFVTLPQLHPADQRALGVALREGHPGVDVVIARLQDGQPTVAVVADVPANGVVDVPLEITRWRDRRRGLKLYHWEFLFTEALDFRLLACHSSFLTCRFLI